MTSLESSQNKSIDLRGVSCPLNYVRCRLALESIGPLQTINFFIDQGEPEQMVLPSLRRDGHEVQIIQKKENWIELRVVSCEEDIK
tara:strand:+ start:214 stop:471 length:258 start_codon:yes stop_codon:yes gene_type:complete